MPEYPLWTPLLKRFLNDSADLQSCQQIHGQRDTNHWRARKAIIQVGGKFTKPSDRHNDRGSPPLGPMTHDVLDDGELTSDTSIQDVHGIDRTKRAQLLSMR